MRAHKRLNLADKIADHYAFRGEQRVRDRETGDRVDWAACRDYTARCAIATLTVLDRSRHLDSNMQIFAGSGYTGRGWQRMNAFDKSPRCPNVQPGQPWPRNPTVVLPRATPRHVGADWITAGKWLQATQAALDRPLTSLLGAS